MKHNDFAIRSLIERLLEKAMRDSTPEEIRRRYVRSIRSDRTADGRATDMDSGHTGNDAGQRCACGSLFSRDEGNGRRNSDTEGMEH